MGGRFPVETQAHLKLKSRAVAFLRRLGCAALATEVRCPIPRFRVDAAGYLDREPATRRRCEPCTVLIECKQARSDFLRDREDPGALLALRDSLRHLREQVEEQRIKRHEPHLRVEGSSLFAELERWDFASSRLAGYRRLLERIRDVERRLYGHTKFLTIARYALADRLYLAAPAGLIEPRELPEHWGLLTLARSELQVSIEAPPRPCKPRHRARLLRDIAVAASRAAHPP
jgi:hypothetical protein